MLRNDLTPHQYRVRFLDGDIERTHYTDDRGYYERLIAQHGHLSDLRITPLVLTAEQQQRLGSLPTGLTPHDASVYVQYGTAESEESAHYDAALIVDYHRDRAEPAVKAQRKDAEAKGVTIHGIRYAGDPSNRQALSEALDSAADSGATTFPGWKDSDGRYRTDHPVSDVRDALRKIGQRRSALIALEAQHVADVADGAADIQALDWATEYD